MKRVLLALVAASLLVSGAATRAAADDVAVVVNKANPASNLTLLQLRKILLAQEGKWPGGGKIVVWMTPQGQADRTTTLKTVCDMTETDFTLHFMHASFNGDSGDPPRTAASAAQVREWVAGAPNGLGFIWASQVNDSVKVLAIDGNRPGQPAYKLRPK